MFDARDITTVIKVLNDANKKGNDVAGVSVKVDVVGLKDALKTLNKLDKSLRREITKDYKKIVQPVIDDANKLVPTGAPLSGMTRNWQTRSGFLMLPWIPGYKQKSLPRSTLEPSGNMAAVQQT